MRPLLGVCLMIVASVGRADDGPRLRLRVPGDAEQHLFCVTFSPDGKTVAVGASDKRIHLFDAASGKLLRSFGNHIDVVWTVVFSPGSLITTMKP